MEKVEKFVLSNEQEKLHSYFVEVLEAAMNFEKVNMTELSVISDTTLTSLNGFFKRGRPTSSFNLVKIANALGFELALVKRPTGTRVKDDLIAQQKLIEYREKNKYAKRKERGYKGVRENTATKQYFKRVESKHGSDSYLIAQSRKKQIDGFRQNENDFLSTD